MPKLSSVPSAEILLAGAGEVDRALVGHVSRCGVDQPPVHWNMLPGKFSVRPPSPTDEHAAAELDGAAGRNR